MKLEYVYMELIDDMNDRALCLVEHEMLKFRPSLLAAAATFSGFKLWSKTSTTLTTEKVSLCEFSF